MALTSCRACSGHFGDMLDRKNLYQIEPLDPDAEHYTASPFCQTKDFCHDTTALQITEPHLFYSETSRPVRNGSVGTCGRYKGMLFYVRSFDTHDSDCAILAKTWQWIFLSQEQEIRDMGMETLYTPERFTRHFVFKASQRHQDNERIVELVLVNDHYQVKPFIGPLVDRNSHSFQTALAV